MYLLLLKTGECATLLCVLTLTLYVSPLLKNNTRDEWRFMLMYDDTDNFVENPILQGAFLFSWENLFAMATMRKISVYEPLSWLLKATIVQCVGLNSWAVRMVTVVLHFAAGGVLVRVSVLLIEISDLWSSANTRHVKNESISSVVIRLPSKGSNQYMLGCYLSALLFLVHPIHVEVVGWPSAQPYALAALFANASLLVYVSDLYQNIAKRRALDEDLAFVRTGPPRKSDWVVAGLYLCSVLSKSAAVLLPAAFILLDMLVLLKLDHTFQNQRLKPQDLLSYVLTKAPVLSVMLSFIGITVWSNIGSADVFVFSLYERILKTLTTPGWTLRHILWPAKLRVHYQTHEGDYSLLSNPECILSVAVFAVFCVAGLWYWKARQAPQVLLGMAYFMIMALPTSSLVQHGVVSQGCDRYAYLPTTVLVPFGGFVLGKYLVGDDKADGVYDQVDRKSRTKRAGTDRNDMGTSASDTTKASSHSTAMKIYLQWGIYIATLAASTWISTLLLETWRTERALYAHNLSLDRTDWRVYEWQVRDFLGASDTCKTHEWRCRQAWELAYVFAPNTTLKAKLHRSQSLYAMGEGNEACRVLDALVPQYPESLPLANNVGMCRVRDGLLDEARALFHRAAYELPAYEGARDIPIKNLKAFDTWMAEFQAKHGDRAMTPEESSAFFGTVMW